MEELMKKNHYVKPVERPFLEEERREVTILFGGLTLVHEKIVKGLLEGLGYRADYLPTPDNDSLRKGREFCNRGQCNPTYYTVGNLLCYLEELRQKGEKDIEDKYVFATIGSCGPCRFGMYESEYRKALGDAGFGKFRVITFNQSGDMDSTDNCGLKRDREFYTSLIKGIMVGDMINELKYAIRPYEVNPGETDHVVKKSVEIAYNAVRERRALFLSLREIKKSFGRIEVDYLRIKPKVKLIGEFWAQTTEGDGNYNMAEWLEKEGCEVKVEPVSGWVDYTLWWWKAYVKERLSARKGFAGKRSLLAILLKLKAVDLIFKLYYNLYRFAIGGTVAPLPSQKKLAKLGSPYYNPMIGGGEGHLEVAKNIEAIREKTAHLVISLKPFGCMPSTQSDGIQARVMSDHKDGLFIPVETSGDGEVHVKSRVQMKLFEAKERVRHEVDGILNEKGIDKISLREKIGGKKFYYGLTKKLPSVATSTAGSFINSILKQRIV